MKNSRIFWAKALCALGFALTLTIARAEPADSADEALERSAKAALHQKGGDTGIRVQARDGVVYLYGRAVNRPHRIDIETVVREAVSGHQVISSIEDSPVP